MSTTSTGLFRTTSNPFAILLWIYERYKRVMLNDKELSKIAKKYGSQPRILFEDLKNKYPHFSIPTDIAILELQRLIATYSIPEQYRRFLPSAAGDPPYTPQHDMHSALFDPHKVLTDHFIITAKLDVPPLDNMTNVWRLLPGNEAKMAEADALLHRPTVSTTIETKASERRVPIEQRIAEETVQSSGKRKNANDASSLEDSPFFLLLQLMRRREKATIVIRRRNSIRGKMHGYIKGFDKHFNLALTDIDEEYYPSTIDSSKPTMSGIKMLKRHLPQVLVRGDNVVSVYRYKRSILT